MMTLALLPAPATAQVSRVERATFDTVVAMPVHMRYLVDLPAGYGTADTTWPLGLFLHGAGERGHDLDALRSQGLPKLAAGSFRFILVSPQVPLGDVWSVAGLEALVQHLEATLSVDRSREYLTGISMGAFGALELAMAMPTRFAAVAAISGGANPVEICRLRDVPVWIAHGGEDDVILSRGRRIWPVAWSGVRAVYG
jgi:predicted peptidase